MVPLAAAAMVALVACAQPEPGSRATGRTDEALTSTTSPTAAPAVAAQMSSTTSTTVPSRPLADAVAFVGDSLAENLGSGLAAAGPQRGISVFDDAISGCGVTRSGGFSLSGTRSELSPTCAAWSDTWSERLRRDRPKVVAIQVGRHEVLDRLYEGRWTNILDPVYRAYVRRELETGIRIAGSEGAKVVLLTAPRFRRPDRPGGGQWPENDPARVDRFNDLLRELATVDRTLVLIDLGARTSPGATYVDVVDGVAVRSDGVHYSRAGVEWIGSWLLPQLTPLLRS